METSVSLLDRLTTGPPTPTGGGCTTCTPRCCTPGCAGRGDRGRRGRPGPGGDAGGGARGGRVRARGPGAFRGWLRGILANRLLDFFRGRRARPSAPGGSDFAEMLAELESPDSPLSRLWDREHDEFVAGRAMQRVRGDFTPATWEAFRLHVLEGRAAAEVAAELSVSLNVVLLAKSRVLQRTARGAARPGGVSH